MLYDTPDEEGLTRRERLPEGACPEVEVPLAGQFVWPLFWQLNEGRQSSSFGPCPLSWQEIAAWQGLAGVRLAWREVQMIKAMDAGYLSAAGERTAKRAKGAGGANMTPVSNTGAIKSLLESRVRKKG